MNKKKTTLLEFPKCFKNNLFFCTKSLKVRKFTNLMPETESQNSGDHDLGDYEIYRLLFGNTKRPQSWIIGGAKINVRR